VVHDTRPARAIAAPIILVVEDEVLIRFLIADEIRALGVTAVECATADEAWDYFRSGARVDLVFIDVRMPGSLDGLAFASKIRERSPTLPIFVTSGHLVGVSTALATRFIPKPYDFEDTAKYLVELARHARQAE
jgi:CheY-like chemotaxis protein